MSTKITAELVKELRESTGVSVMQCKNALEEADGDMDKALIILKNKSSSIAMKKADRNAKDGIIVVKGDDKRLIMLVLHTETDFVAKNEDFVNLANNLVNIAYEKGIDEMKAESLGLINLVVQKVGEKIELGKVEEIKGEVLGSYVHGNKSATIVSLEGGSVDIAKDVAMHIAAMKPTYTYLKDVSEEDKAKVIEVFEKEVSGSDKGEDIKKKMLDGKISTYFKEQTLMEQSFIKNSDLTVGKLLENNGAKLVTFIRESIN